MPSILTQIVSTSVATQVSRNDGSRSNRVATPQQLSVAAQTEAAKVTLSQVKDRDRVPSQSRRVEGVFASQKEGEEAEDQEKPKDDESEPTQNRSRLTIRV